MNITLDVCGQIFKTDYNTIIKIPYFRDMFEACGEAPNETVFVNRPPHIFKHILAFIIDPLYPFPKKYAFELDFYGIDYKNKNLYEQNSDKIKELNDKIDYYQHTNVENITELTTTINVLNEEITDKIKQIYTDQSNLLAGKNKCMTCDIYISSKNKYCDDCNINGIYCNVRNCYHHVASNQLYCNMHK